MKRKNRTAVCLLVIMIILTGVLVGAPGCMAGDNQQSSAAVQYSDLSMSPFKGPAIAPVVITVFSDFQ